MVDGRKASWVAHHGIVNGECGSTAAGLWCVLELPVISDADGISEFSLVKKKPWSESGRAISRNEDPFCTARSTYAAFQLC